MEGNVYTIEEVDLPWYKEKIQLLASYQAEIDRLERVVAAMHKEILEATGSGTAPAVAYKGYKVSVALRTPPRQVNVVGLVKAGYKKEAFSQIRPTVKALTEMGHALKWTDQEIEQWIIPGEGEPTRYVRIERLKDEEEE